MYQITMRTTHYLSLQEILASCWINYVYSKDQTLGVLVELYSD